MVLPTDLPFKEKNTSPKTNSENKEGETLLKPFYEAIIKLVSEPHNNLQENRIRGQWVEMNESLTDF